MGDPQRLPDGLGTTALLLTPEEAAEVLRVGRTTIYALMKAGELRPVHIGRSCRLSRAELTNEIAGRLTSGDSGDVCQLWVAEEASDDLR